MNTLGIKGDGNITKGKLKPKWAKLTDNDLHYAEGQEEAQSAERRAGGQHRHRLD